MLLAWFKSSPDDMSIWTETMESTVYRLVKFVNSYDVHYICPTCTEKYIREDYYEEDSIPLGRAYVAAILDGLAIAQRGFEIASTCVATLGGPTGKELLSVQDNREVFESVRVSGKKLEELTRYAYNRFSQVYYDTLMLAEKFEMNTNFLERIKIFPTNAHIDLLRAMLASLAECMIYWGLVMFHARYVANKAGTSLREWVMLVDLYISFTREVGTLKPKLDRLSLNVEDDSVQIDTQNLTNRLAQGTRATLQVEKRCLNRNNTL